MLRSSCTGQVQTVLPTTQEYPIQTVPVQACLGMKIVSYLDNDELNRPETGGALIYSVDVPRPLSPQQLIEQYPTVFGEGVG